MTTWYLVRREISYRKGSFLLSMFFVLTATTCVVAAVSLLARYDRCSEQRAAAQEADVFRRAARLEDDFRKISLKLGFNLLILPKDQNLADFYADDFASKLMPEDCAERLVKANVATINHILPILQQKMKWPEQARTIQLVGTRGEIALLNKGKKASLLDPVPPGRVVVGYELHQDLKLAVGDTITLSGRRFTVSALQPQRGNQDDITLWINLPEAQELLSRQGQINAILAIECNCTADRLDLVCDEIAKVLPDTQVVEFSSQAMTRAEARNRAAVEARAAVDHDHVVQKFQQEDRQRLCALLVPVVIGVCTVLLGLLAWLNVRSRQHEIGILRALGVPTRRILLLFLLRAALIGLLGAMFGFGIGALVGWLGEEIHCGGPGGALGRMFDPLLFTLILVLTPVFSALVSWLPALWAAQLDPAESLRS